jgi:hypothetical protein
MPNCKACSHKGGDHEWKRSDIRGWCRFPQCECRKYIPDVLYDKPVNSVIGRMRYKDSCYLHRDKLTRTLIGLMDIKDARTIVRLLPPCNPPQEQRETEHAKAHPFPPSMRRHPTRFHSVLMDMHQPVRAAAEDKQDRDAPPKNDGHNDPPFSKARHLAARL